MSPVSDFGVRRGDSNPRSGRHHGPTTISGVVLAPGDTSPHGDGALRWTEDTVESLAFALNGTPLTAGTPRSRVGEVTAVDYDPDDGITFEADLDDPALAEKIDNGRLDIAPATEMTDQLAPDYTTDADYVPTRRQVGEIRRLEIVQHAAADSSHVTVGGWEDSNDSEPAGDKGSLDYFGSGGSTLTSTTSSTTENTTMHTINDEETEELAQSAVGGREAAAVAETDMSTAEFVRDEYDIDATEYVDMADGATALRDDIAEAREATGGTTRGAVAEARAEAAQERGPANLDMDEDAGPRGEKMAQAAARGRDHRDAMEADLSMREHFEHEYSIDATEYDSEDALRADLEDAREEQGR